LIKSSGIVEAVEVVVSAEVSGKVLSVNFDEGSRVDSGFVLCRIDTEMIYQQLVEARAQLELAFSNYQLILKGARREEIEAARAEVNSAKVALENARRKFKRVRNLYSENVATREQYDDAMAYYEMMRARYDEVKRRFDMLRKGAREEEIKIARANYEKARAKLRMAEIQMKRTKVIAPISGYIVSKFVEVGEVVSAGAPVAKIANLDEVYVRIYIPEVEIGYVKLGDTVDVRVDSHPNKVLKGRVTFISPKAEFTPKNVQTRDERVKLVYAVKVKVKNSDKILKIGVPVDIEIKKR
jgi:HlyD family secretion protein